MIIKKHRHPNVLKFIFPKIYKINLQCISCFNINKFYKLIKKMQKKYHLYVKYKLFL